jgi:type VI secretion system secreted protein VgrG
MASVSAEMRSVLGAQRNHARVSISSGDALDVRQFTVHQRMSALFQVSLVALSENANIDFDAVVGKEATFTILTNPLSATPEPRFWKGVCNHFQLLAVEASGGSTYQMSLVPALWFATQRRNHRMFQQISEPDIVLQMLREWGVTPEVRIDKGAYKKRKYRVQYGESDFAFMSRMLEDAGIAFYFEQTGDENKLVLSDAPQKNAPRASSIPFNDSPTAGHARGEHATGVRVGQQVRPGKVTLRDHDYRMAPSYKLMASASSGKGVEEKLERFYYAPGAFLFGTDKGESTPHADDRGKTRTDEGEGAILAQKRLDAQRGGARTCTFETNTVDLAPGMVIRIDDHPHAALGAELLVVEMSASGTSSGDWACHCEARAADQPYRPPLATPKPETKGVESATVVGPAGEEIHTDEFGRVRVHFHWDRESAMDEKSSCWIHVSQSWGGAGYGGSNLPRVGQEVLVDFVGGDPDRPIITGRVYTNLQKKPYKLPENKTQSGWKSNSTGGTGGYNELMFEDAGGKELFRMQAEKDHHKLVKNDEQGTIGNNRGKSIGNDDSISIGNNRSSMVGSNNSEVIGGNESIAVGGNQGITIGGNQDVTITGNQTEGVTGDRKVTITGSDKLDVTGTQDVTVTGAQTTTLEATHEIKVTSDQSIKVGGTQKMDVTGPAMLTSSALQSLAAPVQQISADATQTLTSTILSIDASAVATIQTVLLSLIGSGAVQISGATITSTAAGEAALQATAINIAAASEITLSAGGSAIKISGAGVEVTGGSVKIAGGSVDITGGIVKIN